MSTLLQIAEGGALDYQRTNTIPNLVGSNRDVPGWSVRSVSRDLELCREAVDSPLRHCCKLTCPERPDQEDLGSKN